MSNDNQSQGREDNAAIPVDDWASKGIADRDKKSGKDEDKTKDDIPDAHDLTGPAGDPAEGKRPGGSSWPA